ncbi:bifunctional diguanylate cyclase/phosphodiesterase [Clostridium aceticum]|uniref:bifunctional diguanylate cyclase/phosphodiesterase n=1 Tax=Clostridium aceticum TaxID=84022 RepID=UPI0006966765|nr:EAL domain-containing protein [Clostridium aceticum]
MNILKHRSIKQKFFSMIITGIILLAFIFISFYSLFTKSVVVNMLHENNLNSTEAYANIVGYWLQERTNEIELYAENTVVKTMDLEKVQPYLQREMERKSHIYDALFIAEADGTYHTQTVTYAGNLAQRYYFPKVMMGEKVFSDPLISLATNEYISVIAVPIRNQEGEIIGLMGGGLNLAKLYYLIEVLKIENREKTESYSYIVDKLGRIITHPNETYIFQENIRVPSSVVGLEVVEVAEKILAQKKGQTIYTHNQIESDVYFHEIPNTDGWKIVSKVPTYNAANSMLMFHTLLITTGILVVVLGIIGGSLLVNKNTKPIIDLKEAFDKASKGDLTVRAETKYSDELGEAGKSFNLMMEKISALTYYDAVTGLPNRNYMIEELAMKFGHKKSGKKKLSIVLFTLSKFKTINDMYGFEIGDEVLREVANRIKEKVGLNNKVIRMTGDDFIVLFYEMGTKSKVIRKTEDLLEYMSQPFMIKSHSLHIHASAGIVFCPEDGDDVDTLLKNVSAAKIRAKAKGRSQYQIYSKTISKQLSEEMVIEKYLYEAAENQDFMLYYQPFIDMEAGKVVGTEALIRWYHPKKGFIPPDKFIPLAEKTGLIVPIGNWVLQEACRQNKAWQDQGYKPITMSINISALQFARDDFIEVVKCTLKEVGLAPEYIALEITEGIAVENIEENILKLRQLKELGVKISIDDFGTGFSSLSYFTKFPIDSLKIDRSFIQNITNCPQSRAIVSTIISMGRALGIENIAEGIETKNQLDFIKKENCNKAQGYLFSKPITPKDFEKLLIDNKKYS